MSEDGEKKPELTEEEAAAKKEKEEELAKRPRIKFVPITEEKSI